MKRHCSKCSEYRERTLECFECEHCGAWFPNSKIDMECPLGFEQIGTEEETDTKKQIKL